ncbi:MAG: ABC transporter ATP-binding protein [Thermodesulfobacteriota bacterium]
MNSSPIYELLQVSKYVRTPVETLCILEDIHLEVQKGESLAIIGASGSGKTTLLQLMGAIDRPSQGRIIFQGRDIDQLDPKSKAALRGSRIGFVFQFHHLLPEFSTLENAAMPALIAGESRPRALEMARAKLEMVGLGDKAGRNVTTLSGGERQLAAIARATALDPEVILADEPTGNLDPGNWSRVGNLLADLNRELGTTLVLVTHNLELAEKMQRRMQIQNGRLYACP